MQIVIILAAGKSRRLKGIDKIFYKIKGKPLIYYTILAFEENPQVNKIILVARKKDFKKIFLLIKKYKPRTRAKLGAGLVQNRSEASGSGFKKIAAIVQGGKERQDSALKGLKAAEKIGAKPGDLILFHNGANPLISQKEISDVIRATKKYKAALVAQPAKDTLKKITKNGFVIETVERKNIYSAQTPQVIEYNLAKKAFEKAIKEKFYGTDDVSLVERLKKRVKIVPASSKNIKITYLEDLKFVQNFLK